MWIGSSRVCGLAMTGSGPVLLRAFRSIPRRLKIAGFFLASIAWRRTSTKRWESYRFHEAANRIYDFFWGDFCDWYLELIKPRLARGANREAQNSCRESGRASSRRRCGCCIR